LNELNKENSKYNYKKIEDLNASTIIDYNNKKILNLNKNIKDMTIDFNENENQKEKNKSIKEINEENRILKELFLIKNDNNKNKSESQNNNEKTIELKKLKESSIDNTIRNNDIENSQRNFNIGEENKNININSFIDIDINNNNLKENLNVNDNFDFYKIIEKNKNIYKKTSILKYFFSCFRNEKNKNKYLSLKNGIFMIDKKLELIRYIKNLQMLRIIGKITMINHERYFFKNYYKDSLSIDSVQNENKTGRHLSKYNAMMEYIKNKSNDDFFKMDKPSKMIFKNIFNQGDFERSNNK